MGQREAGAAGKYKGSAGSEACTDCAMGKYSSTARVATPDTCLSSRS